MNRALSILTALGVAAILVMIGKMLLLSVNPGADIHKPRGYELVAELFLRHRWIALDEESKAALKGDSGATAANVYRRSFLRGDVEDFNGGKSWIFQVENQQIKSVDATRHNIVLPYGNVETWRGSLRYRPSGAIEASLRGVGVDIRVNSLTRNLLDQSAPEEVTLRGDLNAEAASRARAEVVNVYGWEHVYLGKVNLAGDSIVVNNRNSPASVSMWIGGNRLPQGNRAWLEAGDLLKLEWRPSPLRRSRYVLLWSEGGRSADVISAPCAINGKWSRCPEESPLPLATDVIAALDSGVASKTARTVNDFDVVMTLDRELHETVQAALERDRRQPPRAPTSGVAARRRETRAAVTVMDALTGEILALASYPTKTALSRVDLPPQVESRLLRNHNFARLPVGSVAKVVLGAAIVDADPRLVSLQLRQHTGESVDSVTGIFIDPPIESHPVPAGDDGVVDFHEFLKYSSNEYAAVLLTAASATRANIPLPVFTGPPLPAEGRYSIAGQLFARAPSPTINDETRLNLHRDREGRIVAGTLSNLEGEPWGESFRKLFGVDKIVSTPIDGRPPLEGDQIIDTSVWKPVLDHLYNNEVPRNHPLRAVGFERENLALNLSHVYRTQLLSLMYGGAAARFTNPKLCEMFSRLVTGRRIERTLVLGVPPAGEELPRTAPRHFPPLELDGAVRGEVLRGMAAVTLRRPNGDGGTAKTLYENLAAIDVALKRSGQALGFFSKTGSPRNTITVPSGLSRAVNQLINAGTVSLNGEGILVYRGVPVTDDAESGANPRSLEAIRANAGDLRMLARSGVTSRLLHDALLLYNIEPADRRDALFVVRNGRLYSMRGVRELKATGAVYVFTIAIYPAAARRSAEPLDIDAVRYQPLRALSVAITIEGQGKSTDVAVPFAETLIKEVLWPTLREERRP